MRPRQSVYLADYESSRDATDDLGFLYQCNVAGRAGLPPTDRRRDGLTAWNSGLEAKYREVHRYATTGARVTDQLGMSEAFDRLVRHCSELGTVYRQPRVHRPTIDTSQGHTPGDGGDSVQVTPDHMKRGFQGFLNASSGAAFSTQFESGQVDPDMGNLLGQVFDDQDLETVQRAPTFDPPPRRPRKQSLSDLLATFNIGKKKK